MRTITNCRSCGSSNLSEVLDLGSQHVSDFREEKTLPPQYPLVVVYCDQCKLVQLKNTTPSAEMYHERYGFKSGVNDTLRADLKQAVDETLELIPDADSWLDIASNDGTLLSFVPKEIYRVGVDPITKLCDEAIQHADYIINDFFKAKPHEYSYDVITSISMFYDLDDPNTFVKDVKSVLAENGVWLIQQNYLLTTLKLGAIDNICHEHLEYYTLTSLEHLLKRHGLEVFKVTTSMNNGGSIRTWVARKGEHEIDESVENQRRIESAYGVNSIDVYEQFGDIALNRITELRDLIYSLADQDKAIYIYGASTRGATIWQAAGIDENQVSAAVERNPDKVGKWFSAIGVPIISEAESRRLRPDYLLIGPWFVADEILARETNLLENGAKAIIPLPEVRVV